MRIIAGKLKGRKLLGSQKGDDLRPTTDRNREALFNILSSGAFLQEVDFDLKEARVLDLCCGTGAVGFEALSRGAQYSYLIDKSEKSLEIAKKNAYNLNLKLQTGFFLADATSLMKADRAFDLIFIDPPYDLDCSEIVVEIIKKGWVDEKSLIVIETSREQSFEPLLRNLDLRKYGKSFFGFYIKK